MNKQNSGLRAFFTVLMLIPLGFIIYFAVTYINHNIPVNEIVGVSVTAGDGRIYNHTDDTNRKFFLDVYLDAVADDRITKAPEGITPTAVTCDRGDKRIDYSLYPDKKTGDVLLMDENGHFYTLPKATKERIMVRDEFQYLYAEDLLPSFTVTSGDRVQVVEPTSYKWSYKKADGNYYSDKISAVYGEEKDLRIYSDRENSISFSTEPDTIELRINGESVAPGSFSQLAYSADTALEVSLRATWVSNGNNNHGSAEYNFNILYDIPAKVYLSNNVCARGETLLLRVDMLTDGESVELVTDLVTTAPEFEVQAGVAYAILPVSLENETGSYELKFISGENEVNLTLQVVDAGYGFGTYHYPHEIFLSHVGSEKVAEFEKVLDETVVFGSAMFFTFDSPFAAATEGGTPLETFGKSIVISDESAAEAPFSGYVPGDIYIAEADTTVSSMQRGKVVFVGETAMTGKTVIISHGMGIYSYYFSLDSVSVVEGSTVQKGATVGKAGTSPLAPADTDCIVHTAISVGKVFVSDAPFIEGTLFTE